MRYLMNDDEAMKLAITLIFATLHIGPHGSNEKDKIRTTLRSILNHVFNYSEEEATFLKREGNLIGDQTMDEGEIEKYCQKDFYELMVAAQEGEVFRFKHYKIAEKEMMVGGQKEEGIEEKKEGEEGNENKLS